MAVNKERFGEYLVSREVLTRGELSKLLGKQKMVGEKLGITAVREGLLDEGAMIVHLSGYLGIPLFSDTVSEVNAIAVNLIPKKMCLKNGVLPVAIGKNRELLVACSQAVPKAVLQNMSRLAQKQVKLVLTGTGHLKKLQNHYFSRGFDTSIVPKRADAVDAGTFVVEIFEKIMVRAINLGVSDIHVEPEIDELKIRFRIDGVMKRTEVLPRNLTGKLISRIKVLAGLDIAEKRKPQDGSFAFSPQILDVEVDRVNLRVSVLPVINGEKAVLRLLPPHDETIDINLLGMDKAMGKRFNEALASPYGIVLVTGPTGSGKSTTLYGVLQKMRDDTTNITTLEDPVELTVRGINQTQAESGKLTFASGLRAILRQDPDIIMVGEIRDTETLEISLRAAITGHLVLSTLHTNDAPSAFSRMVDMGAEPFLIAASVKGVLAQRLARKVCPNCGRWETITRAELAMLGLSPDEQFQVRRGTGCKECSMGYKGRTGIFEYFAVDDDARNMIMERVTFDELKQFAVASKGFKTLRDDGIAKIRRGITTPEEIIRVTMD